MLESSRAASSRTLETDVLFKSRTCLQVEYLLIGYIMQEAEDQHSYFCALNFHLRKFARIKVGAS